MRCLLFGCFLALCSCSGVSSKTDLVKDAQNDIERLEKNLPSECKSESINASLRAISDKITAISLSCDNRELELKEKVTNRNLLIVVLSLILSLIIYKKR